MKRGLLIWNILLSLATGLLLFLQFAPKKNNKDTVKITARDTTVSNQFRIAYFEMDSVEANFNVVRDVKADINEKEIEKNNSKNQLDQLLKNKYNQLVQKAPMTPEDDKAAQAALKIMSDSINNQKQEIEQVYNDFVMRKNLELKKKVKDFILIFNADKKYSYIITYEPDMHYFTDTAYDITAEIIKGLNEYYKPEKK
jgi:outer membrane protein